MKCISIQNTNTDAHFHSKYQHSRAFPFKIPTQTRISIQNTNTVAHFHSKYQHRSAFPFKIPTQSHISIQNTNTGAQFRSKYIPSKLARESTRLQLLKATTSSHIFINSSKYSTHCHLHFLIQLIKIHYKISSKAFATFQQQKNQGEN
jgi:hypothetical protein